MSCLQVLLSSLAIVFASAAPYYWAGKNGDAFRTGASPYVAPSDLSAGPAWSFEAPGFGLSRSHPLIDDELNIYYSIVALGNGTDSIFPGSIVKFTAKGEQLWMYNATSQIPNGPSLYDGRLVFMTEAGNVSTLDMSTGKELWSTYIGLSAPDTHSMTAAEGYVIAPVRTLDELAIPVPLPPPLGPISVLNQTGYPENQLVALNASTGHVIWRFNADTMIYNSLSAVVDGSVVVADGNGRTYRLDLATGNVLWKHEAADNRNFTGLSTGGAIVGPNRVVYVTSNVGSSIDVMNAMNGGRLSAYALETGQLLWRHDLELPANNAAAVGPIGPGGSGPLAVVVVIGQNPDMAAAPGPGSKDGKALAFDAETGERLAWKHELHWDHAVAAGDSVHHSCAPDDASNPAVGGDGTVYFGFEDGRIYALRDADGDGILSDEEISSWDAGNAYQGSPGIAPGMLVACSCSSLHVFTSPAAVGLPLPATGLASSAVLV